MSHQRLLSEFPILPIESGIECWEIDDSGLQPRPKYNDWLRQLASQLIDVAAEYPDQTLYGATTWIRPGTESGWAGYSTWFAMEGSRELQVRAAELLIRLMPRTTIRPDHTARDQTFWAGALYLHEGHVWQPLDVPEWFRVDRWGTEAPIQRAL